MSYLIFGSNFRFVNMFTEEELKYMRREPSKTSLSFLPGLITNPWGVRCKLGMNNPTVRTRAYRPPT